MKKFFFSALIVIIVCISIAYAYKDKILAVVTVLQPASQLPVSNEPPAEFASPKNFNLPPFFSLSVLTNEVPGARTLIIGPDAQLWATLTSVGSVVEIADTDHDGTTDKIITLINGLTKPHGLAQKCVDDVCTIYIAETHQVATYTFDATNKKLVFKEKLVDLPAKGRHYTRSLQFLPYPDHNKLLIAVGSSCDVCEEPDPLHATVQALDTETKKLSPFATGLRNAVFIALHPVTGKPWVTEMGRDFLGDDLPPDELVELAEGAFYGWPYCFGKNQHDDTFDTENNYDCTRASPSLIDLPAHSAPIGLTFIPEEGWPEDWWHDLLVSYHGSWNRSEPTGYKVVRFDFDSTGTLRGVEDFLTGFLTEDRTLYGRPAGLLALPGGIVYISDDKAGRIYKVLYSTQQ
jgi:glucose/arabinose dehydrogenase